MSFSSELLGLLVAVQALLVGALFLFLLLNRVSQNLVSRRRRRWAVRAEHALREWVAGRIEASEAAGVLKQAPLASAREALEEVWPALLDEDRGRLRELARGSGWSRVLRRRSGSVFWWRRMDVAQLLAFVGSEEVSDVLIRLLEDRHMAVRVAGTFAARDLAFPDLLDPLLRQAVLANPPRRRALYDAILSFGEKAVPKVRRSLEEVGEGDDTRLKVLLTLAGRLAERVEASVLLPAVLDRGYHGNLEIRIQAMKALSSFPDRRSVERLKSGLEDTAWEVRSQAAKGLGQLGIDEAREDLRRALGDESWWVRLRAAIALRQLGEAGVRTLESIDAEDDDPYAHDMANYVLRLEDAALTDYAA